MVDNIIFHWYVILSSRDCGCFDSWMSLGFLQL